MNCLKYNWKVDEGQKYIFILDKISLNFLTLISVLLSGNLSKSISNISSLFLVAETYISVWSSIKRGICSFNLLKFWYAGAINWWNFSVDSRYVPNSEFSHPLGYQYVISIRNSYLLYYTYYFLLFLRRSWRSRSLNYECTEYFLIARL